MTSLQNKIATEAKRADEGWGAAYPLFSRILNHYEVRIGVEIGVAFGGHSEAMLRQSQIKKLYGVDPYRHFKDYNDPMNLPQPEFDALYEFTKSRLALFGDRFEAVRETSVVAATAFKDQVDFVYIDALHTYNGVKDDLELWFSKVVDGGIVGGHDYGHPDFPGVKKAVDEFFSRFGWKVNDEGEGVWWVEKKPLHISFIVPAYNCALTIAESLDSIINGNIESGDEIVIVDDGSTDDTKDIVDRYACQFDFIKVVSHSRNKGGAAARNTAVESARNELIFCLDSDNVLVEGSIDKLKRHLIDRSADIASFQELRYFKDIITCVTHRWVFKHGQIAFEDCLAGFVVPIASGNYLFTKESWLRAGGYPEFSGALDAWGFGFRQMATGSKMVTLPDSFYFHRHGHESYWVRNSRNENTSLTATQIIIPHIDQIADRDIKYILGAEGRNVWFELLDKRPLRFKSGVTGRTGNAVFSGDDSGHRGYATGMFKLKPLVFLFGKLKRRLLFGKENI